MREVFDELEAHRGELPGFGGQGTGLAAGLAWIALPVGMERIPPWLEGQGASQALATAAGAAAALLVPLAVIFMFSALVRFPRTGRGGLIAGAWGLAALFSLAAQDAPLVVLATLAVPIVITGSLLGWLSGPLRAPPQVVGLRRARASGALSGALLLWLFCLGAPAGALADQLALVGALGTLALMGRSADNRFLWRLSFMCALLPLLPVTSPGALAVPGLLLGAGLWLRRHSGDGLLGSLLSDPARIMVATFVLAGLTGAALLALPEATESGQPIAFIDALFTAFSAVCVTGLSVVDTPTTFSALGEGVLLVLIQAGGLGIMTFSTAAVVLTGERLSMKHEYAAASLLKASDRGEVDGLLRLTLKFTALVEGVGALSLTVLFLVHGDPLATAVWRGVFTSISAFCNAGFALQSDSLMGYQQASLILMVVAVLITIGGLGPIVMAALARRGRLEVHTRLVLVTSAFLVLGGFGLIAAAEWSNTLAHLSATDKLVNALFQAVTPRTAGFNSVDYGAVAPATMTVTLVLMVVGGSPGSTAGGIKTTTLAVLLLLVRQAFRSDTRVTAFGFSLKVETLRESVTVTVLFMLTVLGLLLALNLTQTMRFDTALFETISAVGTVGLSAGGTAQLDAVGKVLVAAGMLAGRVGPLTLLLVLANRRSRRQAWQPEGRVDVG